MVINVDENIIMDPIMYKVWAIIAVAAIIGLGTWFYRYWPENKSDLLRFLRMGRKLAARIKRIFRKLGRHSTSVRLAGCCILGLLLLTQFTSCYSTEARRTRQY